MAFSPLEERRPFDIEAHKARYAAPSNVFEKIGRAATVAVKRGVNQDRSLTAYPQAHNRMLMRRIGVGVSGVVALATIVLGLHAGDISATAGRAFDTVADALPGDRTDEVNENLEEFKDCKAGLEGIESQQVVEQKVAECQDKAFGQEG